MKSDHQFRIRSRFLFALLAAFILTAPGPAKVFGQAGWTDEQFEQWVFQQYGNSATARTKLKDSLELYTEDVDQTCGLSEEQKRKLRLAGQGDIERFFRKYRKIKEHFQTIRNDAQKVNEIWQQISPLQTEMTTGLFHQDSLLQKCLVNTINRKQFLDYMKVGEERRRFHHESNIAVILTMLDQASPVTAMQRKQLADLLRLETKPPRKSGQYDYYAMMHQASKIDDKKYQAILDDIQWQVFNNQLAQMRGMEQWLKQSGILSDDDDDELLLPDEQVAAE
jgi:hypothetical protein